MSMYNVSIACDPLFQISEKIIRLLCKANFQVMYSYHKKRDAHECLNLTKLFECNVRKASDLSCRTLLSNRKRLCEAPTNRYNELFAKSQVELQFT